MLATARGRPILGSRTAVCLDSARFLLASGQLIEASAVGRREPPVSTRIVPSTPGSFGVVAEWWRQDSSHLHCTLTATLKLTGLFRLSHCTIQPTLSASLGITGLLAPPTSPFRHGSGTILREIGRSTLSQHAGLRHSRLLNKSLKQQNRTQSHIDW